MGESKRSRTIERAAITALITLVLTTAFFAAAWKIHPAAAALAVTISPTSGTLYVGQSLPFTATVSGGSGSYSYYWYWDTYTPPPSSETGAGGGTGDSYWTYVPSIPGSHTVYVYVVDNSNSANTGTSVPVTVLVYGPPPAGYIEVIDSTSTVVWGATTGAGSFANAVNWVNLGPYAGTTPPYEILLGQGFTDTLTASLTVSWNGLWIIGTPPLVGTPTPTIDLGGHMLTITGNDVFIWGLEFTNTNTALHFGPILTGASGIIENCIISGTGTAASTSVGLTLSNSANDLIGLNTVTNWGIGIYITGAASTGNTVELNTLSSCTVGIRLDSGASGNMIWWNNLATTTNTNYIYDTSTTPVNSFDDGAMGNHYVGYTGSTYGVPPNTLVNVDNHVVASAISQIPGDINCDGVVNGIDLGAMAASWLQSWGSYGYDPRADINGDGAVNGLDLSILAGSWLVSFP